MFALIYLRVSDAAVRVFLFLELKWIKCETRVTKKVSENSLYVCEWIRCSWWYKEHVETILMSDLIGCTDYTSESGMKIDYIYQLWLLFDR